MLRKRNKKGFTLVELLAVIVILAVVILIAVTAVIPRMNNAKKKALLDEALMYLKAAKESIVFDGDQSPSCINVSNLNEKYIKKSSNSYTGVVKNEYVNGELSQTINLTNGSLYIVGTDDLTSSDVKSTMPKGFATSCGDYNPILAENADTNTLAYKLLMSEGGSTIEANLETINTRTQSVNFSTTEANAGNSGLYKSEDDDGASFFYRGNVNNNWVEFGDFYWRVLRINGDGSVRLIYTGLKSSTHTGDDASIKNSNNTYTSNFSAGATLNVRVPDVSGLTSTQISLPYINGRYGNTYVGYMYSPIKELATYPNKDVSNSEPLNVFPTFTNVTATKDDYYFFKNFDLNQNCSLGNNTDESGTCILTCRELGVDCIVGNWNTIATTEGNYSTTAAGVYPATNPTQYVYTSPYKYTCWQYATPITKANSDGTTSVYIACPIVSEIIGSVKNQAGQAKLKYHGLFSPSSDVSNLNEADSNAKKEIDLWYQNNILNHKDSSNNHDLEDYLVDEIFCNDRTSNSNGFPFTTNGQTYYYAAYTRNTSTPRVPTFKCPNKSRDGFSLETQALSSVHASRKGNTKLKYPVGLITVDEASYAGGLYGSTNENKSYFLYTGKSFWTMSPYMFYSGSIYAYDWIVNQNGYFVSAYSMNGYGLRPVVNLSKDVLYDSGSGTEADPYKVKLSS